MTIWILALVLLASLAGLGYRQGATRAAFSFVGVVLAACLAPPLGRLLFKPLLPHVGVHSQWIIWLTAPLEAFAVVLVLFKVAGFVVHRKVSLYYKYKAGDLRLALWQRLHHRLGLCVGLLNGAVWLVLLSFVIYNFSYWTTQIAPSDSETRTTRFINRLGQDLQSTGLDKAARAAAAMPDLYYKLADLAGLLVQNPALSGRLGSYPAFLSLEERSDLQQLAQDGAFISAWKNHAPAGQLADDPQFKAILENDGLIDTVWDILQANLDDLVTYLKTGHSPKYGSEKILGRWDFNVSVTAAMLLQRQPTITAAQMRAARAWMSQAYDQTSFVAGADGQAFLKNMPQIKTQPGQPPATEMVTWQGQWKAAGTHYDLSLSANGQSKSWTAQTDGLRLRLKSPQETLVFDREE
ncbi:MAG: CvpA family protein [Verrucomicrobiota bacterium]|nr:CvpA family protein [Verrucomicrobiota bacterium]